MGRVRDLLIRRAGRTRLRQYGVLAYRRGPTGEMLMLLVTSQGGANWIVPKGWPSMRLKPHEAAAREAYQEAGVRGTIESAGYATYRHEKRFGRGHVACDVTLFALEVDEELPTWPEANRRKRRWVNVETAADAVRNRSLAQVIRQFGQSAPVPDRPRSTSARRD